MRGDSNATHGAHTAGYTYFGQFIDHDLTLDLTPLDHAHPNVGCVRNFRTPFLDLDHVYGGGPSQSPFLYENNRDNRNKERFLVGDTRGEGSSQNDLPRSPQGIALVGDSRQDENLIIAQLHVAFLKFHNRVVEDLEHGILKSVGPFGGTLFEQARRLVVWHYQYLLVKDFLTEVIDRTVLEGVPAKIGRTEQCEPRHFRIPVEFSAAAFRFGHSMVRDTYDFYNEHHRDVKLVQDLLYQTGAGGGAVPCLRDEWVINWSSFFDVQGITTLNQAQRIDDKLADGLHNVPLQTIKLFSVQSLSEPDPPSPANRLPVRTLWRGARMGLPSGQDVAKALRIEKPLTEDEIKNGSPEQVQILTTYGFDKHTPLWYYILKEAERPERGEKLGQVGGRIVADVIMDALHADPNSYLSVDPAWKPQLDGQPVCKIMHLLAYAHQEPITYQDTLECRIKNC
jgi:hypothetical protein